MKFNQYLRVTFFILFSIAIILTITFNNFKSIRHEDVIERASIASIAAKLKEKNDASPSAIVIPIYIQVSASSSSTL